LLLEGVVTILGYDRGLFAINGFFIIAVFSELMRFAKAALLPDLERFSTSFWQARFRPSDYNTEIGARLSSPKSFLPSCHFQPQQSGDVGINSLFPFPVSDAFEGFSRLLFKGSLWGCCARPRSPSFSFCAKGLQPFLFSDGPFSSDRRPRVSAPLPRRRPAAVVSGESFWRSLLFFSL